MMLVGQVIFAFLLGLALGSWGIIKMFHIVLNKHPYYRAEFFSSLHEQFPDDYHWACIHKGPDSL